MSALTDVLEGVYRVIGDIKLQASKTDDLANKVDRILTNAISVDDVAIMRDQIMHTDSRINDIIRKSKNNSRSISNNRKRMSTI